MGDNFDIRTFHDELLSGGALPLDVLELRMSACIKTQRKLPCLMVVLAFQSVADLVSVLGPAGAQQILDNTNTSSGSEPWITVVSLTWVLYPEIVKLVGNAVLANVFFGVLLYHFSFTRQALLSGVLYLISVPPSFTQLRQSEVVDSCAKRRYLREDQFGSVPL